MSPASSSSWPRLVAVRRLPTPARYQNSVCYAEVFAGSAALLLSKPRHPVEVVNDLNGDLVALMRNAHFHLPALLEEMRWFVASRKDFHDFVSQPGLTEIQRAARFLLRNRVSFAGGMKSFGVAKTRGSGVGFDWEDVADRLEGIRRRLNKVVVENLPYDRVLQNYDAGSQWGRVNGVASNHLTFQSTGGGSRQQIGFGSDSALSACPIVGSLVLRRCP